MVQQRFRSELASDVGFARAGEGLFAALHLHVSAHIWSCVDPGQEDIVFTSAFHLFLPFFPPLPLFNTSTHSHSAKSFLLQVIILAARNND